MPRAMSVLSLLDRRPSTLDFRFAEDFRLKRPEAGARFAPRPWRKAGLPADFGQKTFPVEPPLGGNLGQEQAAPPFQLDDQPVAPDLDRLRVSYRSRRGQHRNLNAAFRQLVGGKRRKPRVFQGGAQSEPGHGAGQIPFRGKGADAAAKLPAPAQRHEESAGLPERFRPVRSEPRKWASSARRASARRSRRAVSESKGEVTAGRSRAIPRGTARSRARAREACLRRND